MLRKLGLASLMAVASAAARHSSPAQRTMRGVNSWDSELGNWDEQRILEIATYMSARLLPYGYDTLTTDEGWFWTGDAPNDASLDAYGRPTPRLDQYPSASDGRGFRTIADQLHQLGLKLGVWSIRGVPKLAVDQRTPIFNSSFTADQAVTPSTNCSWNNHCFGCAPNAAGTACNDASYAYFRSMAAWYQEQQIDLVKVDCMWDQRYGNTYDHDLVAFTTAFREVGIAISLSPGPITLENGTFVATNALAAQYRVTQDLWDVWADNGPTSYPTGLRSKLDTVLEFASLFGVPGSSPDLDMLPLGYIQSHATQQPHGPIPSTLTHDEQEMVMSLWAAVGAPLVFGGRLPLNESDPVDAFTYSLLTNPAILAVHNASVRRMPLAPTVGSGSRRAGEPVTANAQQTYSWASLPADRADGTAAYISLFNGDDAPHDVTMALSDAGLAAGALYCATDLWTGARVSGTQSGTFTAALRPHQAGVFALTQTAGQC